MTFRTAIVICAAIEAVIITTILMLRFL